MHVIPRWTGANEIAQWKNKSKSIFDYDEENKTRASYGIPVIIRLDCHMWQPSNYDTKHFQCSFLGGLIQNTTG